MSEVKIMPEGWVETTLGLIAEKMYSGGTPSTTREDYYGGNIPWIRTQEVVFNFINDAEIKISELGLKHSSARYIPKETVIVAMYGNSAGRVALSKIEATTNQACCNIVSNPKTSNPYFMFYNLLGRYKEIEGKANGAAQQNLSIGVLKELEIILPTLSEQNVIASILATFDNKIELLQAQNKTLEETAQTIFAEWFGKYQIGDELPDGWKFGELGDVAINHTKTFKFANDNVVFVNTGDVLEGQFLHSNEVSPIGLPGQAKKAIELHDILYSEIRPKNKRFAFVDFDTSNYVVSTKFMIIRPKNDFSPFILYLILQNQDTVDEFNIVAESRSGTFPQITFAAVRSFRILIPSKEKQNDFDKLLMPIMEKKKLNHQQIRTLNKTRNELLPRLMSGEIRVKEFKK